MLFEARADGKYLVRATRVETVKGVERYLKPKKRATPTLSTEVVEAPDPSGDAITNSGASADAILGT